jgi:hypothetical protein
MTDSPDPRRFAAELLRQDESPTEAEYQAYRGKLENAVRASERWAKWTGRVVAASCIIGFMLMFAGGSKVFGDFDPWSQNATPVSVALGLIFALAIVVFLLSAMAYFWWFQPGVLGVKGRLRDANILDLRRQLRELREAAGAASRPARPDAEPPPVTPPTPSAGPGGSPPP